MYPVVCSSVNNAENKKLESLFKLKKMAFVIKRLFFYKSFDIVLRKIRIKDINHFLTISITMTMNDMLKERSKFFSLFFAKKKIISSNLCNVFCLDLISNCISFRTLVTWNIGKLFMPTMYAWVCMLCSKTYNHL